MRLFALLLLLTGLFSSCKLLNTTQNDNQEIISSPTDNHQVTSSSFQDYIREDVTTIENILERGSLLEQMHNWKGKALFIKVNENQANSRFDYYYYQAIYQDTNQNQIQDSSDQGFFNPASTVKVGISALVLEQLNQLKLPKETEYRILGNSTWHSFNEDIKNVLIISDNEATNRLILFLGFQNLNLRMRGKGLNFFSVNRLMLNQGTLVDSPAFELRFEQTITQSPPQTVSQDFSCFEVGNKLGNCASATDLAEILIRLVQPTVYSPEEKFNLREQDRLWLQEIMSQTPQQADLNYENTFCRFLHPLSQKIANKTGKLLSKCGVGLFSHTFVDTSFIETDQGQKYYIVFAVNPPQNISKNQAINWMNTVSQFVLNALSKTNQPTGMISWRLLPSSRSTQLLL
ncbi:MAG: serine hydrolase [Symploca sp. SIO2E6]|nr:serine hydrolase [Symploca sp. SIO2E6]